jgi:S-formylglutathione hydrolase FrmB
MRILKTIILLILIVATQIAVGQKIFIVKSKHILSPDTSCVFYPTAQKTFLPQKYPVVIMLHGHGGDYKQWSKITDLQAAANKYNFIIVCPDGGKDSWYFDSPLQRKSHFESFFINDYLPYLKKNLSIDTNAIFITGMSMGGHGAMYLFLRHPELFASAGSTSGVLDLKASSNRFGTLSDKLGEYQQNKKRFDEYSAINNLKNIKFTKKPIIFDCGNKDHLYKANKLFKAKCDTLYINAFYFSFSGRHNRMYWRKSIGWHFKFFNRIYLNGAF